jgi:hypothetical protein
MGRVKKITNGAKVSFYVPVEWHEVMKRLAEENVISIADIYREAVKEYVEKHRVQK